MITRTFAMLMIATTLAACDVTHQAAPVDPVHISDVDEAN